MPPKKPTGTATKSTGTKAPVKKGATKTATKTPTASKGATAAPTTDQKKVEDDLAKMAIKKVLVPEELGLKQIANLVLSMEGELGNKCKESGRWLFIIDRTDGNVHTFLKYRDVNMISMESKELFQAEPLRRALQGALKWSKPHIIDISEIDQSKALDIIKEKYNEIYSGCWDDLMSKKITEDECISKLYRPNDDKILENPLDYNTSGFHFFLYTKVEPASYANESFFPVVVQ